MSAIPFPYTAQPLLPAQGERLEAAFKIFGKNGLALFGPSKVLLPADAGPFLREYYNTPVHPGDVWIVTLPKCGTTWTQEMVWLIENDCDFAGAESLLCPDRYHFLEIAAICADPIRQEIRNGNNPISKKNMFGRIEDRPRPWLVKTHLPLDFCPPRLLDTAKVVYVCRNPKDMCVSYLNHLKMFEEIDPGMQIDEFAELFMAGEVSELPYFPHVLEAWNQRQHPNLLFLFFEELKRDLRGSILKVADFLGKKLTDKQLDRLETHLSFNSMKNNPWVNKSMAMAYSPIDAEALAAKATSSQPAMFMRKGEVGNWKKHFSRETSEKFDTWINRELSGTGFRPDTSQTA